MTESLTSKNVVHLADFRRETLDNPQVWECGCGSQEWFLCEDGDAVCVACGCGSSILQVRRLPDETTQPQCTCKPATFEKYGEYARHTMGSATLPAADPKCPIHGGSMMLHNGLTPQETTEPLPRWFVMNCEACGADLSISTASDVRLKIGAITCRCGHRTVVRASVNANA